MSGYLSADDVHTMRVLGVPVTSEPPKDCCARCRRGTKAHGTEPECGYLGRCDCHTKGNQ